MVGLRRLPGVKKIDGWYAALIELARVSSELMGGWPMGYAELASPVAVVDEHAY